MCDGKAENGAFIPFARILENMSIMAELSSGRMKGVFVVGSVEAEDEKEEEEDEDELPSDVDLV